MSCDNDDGDWELLVLAGRGLLFLNVHVVEMWRSTYHWRHLTAPSYQQSHRWSSIANYLDCLRMCHVFGIDSIYFNNLIAHLEMAVN